MATAERCLLGLFALGLFPIVAWANLPIVQAADGDPTRSARASQGEWSEIVALTSRGEFDLAYQRVVSLQDRSPGAAKAQQWLGDFQAMQAERRSASRDDFEKYVGYAQRAQGKNNLDRALYSACLALDNSDDQESFQEEAWLGDLVADALAQAAKHRSEGQWREAATLYEQLSYLYERNSEYKKRLRECYTHFRLEYMYRKDSDWQEGLEGINQEMATNSFWFLERSYVETADFGKMTVAGLEQLLLLARTPGLREVFPSLEDAVDRDEFEKRIEKRIAEVGRMTSVRRDDALKYFMAALRINGQTVQLPQALIISEFMRGALETLDDFTSILWPIEFREFRKHTDGEFIGVGIQITMRYGEITVVTPLEGTPAHHAGIQAGDVIAEINGDSTAALTLSKAVQQITGPSGTSVTLTIRRRSADGEERDIEFPLTRQRIKLHSVRGSSRNPNDEEDWNHVLDEEMGIGYIRATTFSKRTTQELHETIEQLRADGMRALILDLRGNPGGLLEAARGVADLFLPSGDLIVRTDGARTQVWEGESDNQFETLPLTILINGQSASASEIVAGALKDHKRAILIGERSFGKFSVQDLRPIAGGDAALKYTTAWYYLPGGANLHHREGAETWGVEPNIEITLVPKERQRLREMIRAANRLGPEPPEYRPPPEVDTSAEANTGDGEKDAESTSETESGTATADAEAAPADVVADGEPADDFDYADENTRPKIDPQLEAALLVTRIRLLDVLEPLLAAKSNDKNSKSAELAPVMADN